MLPLICLVAFVLKTNVSKLQVAVTTQPRAHAQKTKTRDSSVPQIFCRGKLRAFLSFFPSDFLLGTLSISVSALLVFILLINRVKLHFLVRLPLAARIRSIPFRYPQCFSTLFWPVVSLRTHTEFGRHRCQTFQDN